MDKRSDSGWVGLVGQTIAVVINLLKIFGFYFSLKYHIVEKMLEDGARIL